MNNWTLHYVETMYAHFSNMLHEHRNTEAPLKLAFWKARMEYYIQEHEKMVPIGLITKDLPLTPKTEP